MQAQQGCGKRHMLACQGAYYLPCYSRGRKKHNCQSLYKAVSMQLTNRFLLLDLGHLTNQQILSKLLPPQPGCK